MYTITFIEVSYNAGQPVLGLASISTPRLAVAASVCAGLQEGKGAGWRPRNVRVWRDGKEMLVGLDWNTASNDIVLACMRADMAAHDEAVEKHAAWAEQRAALYA